MYDAKFTIEGPPVPKARPRVDRRSGRIYTPTKSEKYEKRVRGEAWAASLRHRVDGRLVRRSPPWPRREDCALERARWRAKRVSCSCGFCSTEFRVELLIVLPDRRTRDVDNIAKSVLDGINGALWRDDRQVAALRVERAVNGDRPRVEVSIEAMNAQASLDMDPGDQSPFPNFGGWETGRAEEWLEEIALRTDTIFSKSFLEAAVPSLAALLRDCWASGFLEGMEGDAETDAILGRPAGSERRDTPSVEDFRRAAAGLPRVDDESRS